jgi:hypothetical protein
MLLLLLLPLLPLLLPRSWCFHACACTSTPVACAQM